MRIWAHISDMSRRVVFNTRFTSRLEFLWQLHICKFIDGTDPEGYVKLVKAFGVVVNDHWANDVLKEGQKKFWESEHVTKIVGNVVSNPRTELPHDAAESEKSMLSTTLLDWRTSLKSGGSEAGLITTMIYQLQAWDCNLRF